MVERVAMAIDQQVVASKKVVAAKSGQIKSILDALQWGDQSEAYRGECRLIARAAITAMREPTKEMIEAGYEAHPSWRDELALGYTAMIDAILK